MTHPDQIPSPESTATEPVQFAAVQGLESVARRRGLLRGLSVGAAVSGAALPMSALATGGRKSCFHKDTPAKKCKASVSGMHSVIASAQVNDWPESPGKHCSHYQNSSNWPADSSGKFCRGVNNTAFRRTAKYKDVFACAGGGDNDKTIGEIMDGYPDSARGHWITACLNATKYGSQFSYTADEIVALHNDPARTLDAQMFFRDYQENYF